MSPTNRLRAHVFLLSMVAFLVLFALPLAVGFREIVRPKDDARLAVDPDYTRDPRFFGNSFRGKIAPLMALKAPVPRTDAFLGRTDERAHIGFAIRVGAGEDQADVLLAFEGIDIADGATVTDIFARNAVRAGRKVRARTITADGSVELGEWTAIERWVDAEECLTVGRNCDLGISASAGSRACVGSGTSFGRIFGNPVVAVGELDSAISQSISPTFDAYDGNVIFTDDAEVAAGTAIAGSIKARRRLTLGPGVTVAGNVIACGDIVVGTAARIDGHVFAEGSLRLERGAHVGTPRAVKTAYGATALTLCAGAVVYGWAVTDGLGQIA